MVAILALIAGSVGAAAIIYLDRARQRTTEANARAIRAAVKAWWVDNDRSACPSVPELTSAGWLERGSPEQDPWGGPWHIECSDDDATIVSAGRDRSLGTADDIRVPPQTS